MADLAPRQGRRGKAPDDRPARARYWNTKQLEKHKVRNLVRCCGMDKAKATVYWRSVRKRRIKTIGGITS
ncbi:hypothetical protein LCGC14_1364170 [marine sediment metagenome]|uniref:Uncharacterized protein n=1 Tax=marine sediment metagenome TaxID=412755 RepID=A0A0F9KTC0_9ZZZZ